MPFRISDFDAVREELQKKLKDYLQSRGVALKGNGTLRFSCINPEHDDSNPSANIVPNTDEREWVCHGCGAKGDIFDAAHCLEGLPVGSDETFYSHTVLELARRFDVAVKTDEMSEEEATRFRAFRAYQIAARHVVESEPSNAFKGALAARGWDREEYAESIKKLGLGQIPNYAKFQEDLASHDFSPEFLEKIGLRGDVMKWMSGPDRMVFCLYDHKKRPIAFTARNLKYEQEKENNKESKKYKNSGASCLFAKGHYLYGIDGAAEDTSKMVFVFEGQADVVSYRLRLGRHNCVAVGGTAFGEHHVALMRDLGLNKICLCLDGDDVGRKKTAEIVAAFGGNPGLSVDVITLPAMADAKDVDAFLRKYGRDGWDETVEQRKTAFAWRLCHRTADEPVDKFVSEQIGTIINEPSPIKSWQMIEELARETDYPIEVIRSQVDYQKDVSRSEMEQQKKALAEQAAKKLQANPMEGNLIIAQYSQRLETLDKEHGLDWFTPTAQVNLLSGLDEKQLKNDPGSYLKTGWPIFDGKMGGIPTEDILVFVGGKANTGKTSLFANLATRFIQHNDDVICVVVTIDDSHAKFVPRMVSRLAKLPGPWISRPHTMYREYGDAIPADKLPYPFKSKADVIKARQKAVDELRGYMAAGSLRIVDLNMTGARWAVVDQCSQKLRREYPNHKIVIFLDNFHNLEDFSGMANDIREKFSELAGMLRNTATRDRALIFSTVEYTKIPRRVKPNNNNMAESRAMEYRADAIFHLVNDLDEFQGMEEQCKVKWLDKNEVPEAVVDDNGEEQLIYPSRPVVEMICGKNKINDFKGSIYFKFHPAICSYEEVKQKDQRYYAGVDGQQPWRRD
jgi:DNA primase catalytic core